MLSNLIFSFNAVIPLFMIILLGFAVRKSGIIDAPTAKRMNELAFKVAMPIMLFYSAHRSDFTEILDTRFIAFLAASIIAFFFICWAVAAKFLTDRKQKGAFVQGCFRGNYVILGVALVTEMLGYTPALATTGVIIVVPLFNILSVIILTIYSDKRPKSKNIVLSILKSIATNPLVIGICAGMGFSLTGVEIVPILGTPISMISSVATPLALLVIGASLDFSQIKERLTLTVVAGMFKLILKPLFFLPLAIWFGISQEGIVVLFVLYAAPTAIASYVMAYNMGADEYLASNIVILTSLLSIVSYTVGVFILRAVGLV